MAIRKSAEEILVVLGAPDEVLRGCQKALSSYGFIAVESDAVLYRVKAKFDKPFVCGEILMTLLPEGDSTKIVTKITADVDSVYTPSSSLTEKF